MRGFQARNTHLHSRIWVTGPGHSGTSVLTWLLHDLGWEVGPDGAEWGPLTGLNTRILTALLGSVESSRNWWKVSECPRRRLKDSLIEEIQRLDLPVLAKDPRWSLTLPHWLSHTRVRPDLIFTVIRDPVECALSWTGGESDREVEDAVRYRSRCLQEAVADAPARVVQLRYPDTFETPETLAGILRQELGLDTARLERAIRDRVDPDRLRATRA